VGEQRCPRCGEPRIGNFAFCRGCGFDFDQTTEMAAPAVDASALPTDVGPRGPAGSAVPSTFPVSPQTAGSTSQGAAAFEPGRPWWRRRSGVATIALAIVVMLTAIGYVGQQSSGSPASPLAVVSSTPHPPATSPTARAPAAATDSATQPSPSVSSSVSSSPSAILALVRIPKLDATIAGATKIRYFSVAGTSPNQLLDQVVAKSKPFCKTEDTLACVMNSYDARWVTTTYFATGACQVTSERVTLTSTVSLPRWTAPARVQPALVTWWKKMFAHFAWHEGQHIKIQRAYDSRLASLLVGQRCSAAQAIVRKWQRSLQAAQDAFDRKDRSWPYPDYTGPGGFYGTP